MSRWLDRHRDELGEDVYRVARIIDDRYWEQQDPTVSVKLARQIIEELEFSRIVGDRPDPYVPFPIDWRAQ